MYFPGAEKSERLTPAWKNSPIKTGGDRQSVSLLVMDSAVSPRSTERSSPRPRLCEEELKNIINEASAMFDDDEDHIAESLILLSGSNEINDDLSSSSSFKSDAQNWESIGTLHSSSIFSSYPNFDNNAIKKASNSNAPNFPNEYQHYHHAFEALDGHHDSFTEIQSSTNAEKITNVSNMDTDADAIERHLLFLDKIDEEVRIILGSNRTQKNRSLTVPARDMYTSFLALSIEELRTSISDQVHHSVHKYFLYSPVYKFPYKMNLERKATRYGTV